MHGFGIARRVEQVSRGVFKVNPGSLLTALQRLERAGLVDAEWRQTANARRARYLHAHARRAEAARRGDRRMEPPCRRCRAAAEGRGLDMAIWRPLARGLRALRRPPRRHRDLADELDHFSAAAVDDLVDRGRNPRRCRLGACAHNSAPRWRAGERVRESGWEHAVETLPADLRTRHVGCAPIRVSRSRACFHWRSASVRAPRSSARSIPSSFSRCRTRVRTAWRVVGPRPRRFAPRRHLWQLPRDRRSQPLVRVSRGDEAVAADAGRWGRPHRNVSMASV